MAKFKRLTKNEAVKALQSKKEIFFWSDEQQAHMPADKNVVKRYTNGLYEGPAKGYFAKVNPKRRALK